MSEYSQPADRAYEISDAWLDKHDGDVSKDRYVDVRDIANGDDSSYVNENGLDATDESRKADFVPSGIFVGSTIDADGLYPVVGCLTGETNRPPKEWWLAGNVVHPLRICRIYPNYGGMRTQARQIRIVGYGANTSLR